MTRHELYASAHLHNTTAGSIRHLLEVLGDMATPGEIREEVQTEVVDALHRVMNHCDAMAKQHGDQAELQSYDSAIEADAQRERMV